VSERSVDPRSEYQARARARRDALAAEERRHRRLGNVRLVVFLLALAMAGAAFWGGVFSAWWLAAPIGALVWLGRGLENLEQRAARLARAAAFYEDGLARLDGRWRGRGETGLEFRDSHHLYERDLDILGEGSVFELLCRARTERGQGTLAAWLLRPAAPETIAERQQAVEELAPRLDLREDLAVAGDRARSGVHPDALVAWAERPVRLHRPTARLAAWIVTTLGSTAAIAGSAWIAAGLGGAPWNPATLTAFRLFVLPVWGLCFAIHWSLRRQTDSAIAGVLQAGHDLDLLASLLARLEADTFASAGLVRLQNRLTGQAAGAERASARIAILNRYVALLAARRNGVMKLLGPLLLWDLHVSQAIERWRRASGPAIREWLAAAGEAEALASLACFRFERPSTTVPEVVSAAGGRPSLLAEDLRHPLLVERQAVPNSLSLDEPARVLIVSGSNMSGKSTLLRTVGVNVVLALAGAPVCAVRLRLAPLLVGASIRIEDSLLEGTSRFYAEITRLSRIVAEADRPAPVLFLLDEILHGTNSHDRLIGATAVVRGLVERGAIGLVTTHDLALARIVDTLGARAANVHFQEDLEDGRLRFDYRLQPGVVQRSTALALMRLVGLDVADQTPRPDGVRSPDEGS
jgi:MutS domain V